MWLWGHKAFIGQCSAPTALRSRYKIGTWVQNMISNDFLCDVVSLLVPFCPTKVFSTLPNVNHTDLLISLFALVKRKAWGWKKATARQCARALKLERSSSKSMLWDLLGTIARFILQTSSFPSPRDSRSTEPQGGTIGVWSMFLIAIVMLLLLEKCYNLPENLNMDVGSCNLNDIWRLYIPPTSLSLDQPPSLASI